MLKALGRRATRLVHGNLRSASGLLLTRYNYLEDDQEWRLGQSYLGLLGFALFVLGLVYLRIFYAHVPGQGHKYILGHWSQLGPDLKILLPLMVVSHLTAMASFVRLMLVRAEIAQQPRSEVSE